MEAITEVTNLEKVLYASCQNDENGKIDICTNNNAKILFKALMKDFQELTSHIKLLFEANSNEIEGAECEISRINKSCIKIEHLAKIIEAQL